MIILYQKSPYISPLWSTPKAQKTSSRETRRSPGMTYGDLHCYTSEKYILYHKLYFTSTYLKNSIIFPFALILWYYKGYKVCVSCFMKRLIWTHSICHLFFYHCNAKGNVNTLWSNFTERKVNHSNVQRLFSEPCLLNIGGSLPLQQIIYEEFSNHVVSKCSHFRISYRFYRKWIKISNSFF